MPLPEQSSEPDDQQSFKPKDSVDAFESVDLSGADLPNHTSNRWRQLAVNLIAGSVVGAGALITGLELGEIYVESQSPYANVYPDTMSEEEAAYAAQLVAAVEEWYRAAVPIDPISLLDESDFALVKEFVEAVTPQLSPSTDDWEEQATQQHLVRMLESLGSELAPAERDRADRALSAYCDLQRAAAQRDGFSYVDRDSQSRELFCLVASCSGSAREICVERLAELDAEVSQISAEQMRTYARKNIEDMCAKYESSRERAERVIASNNALGPFAALFSPAQLQAFTSDLLDQQNCRLDDGRAIYTCKVEGLECADWQVEVYDYGGGPLTVTLRNCEDERLFCSADLPEMHLYLLNDAIPARLEFLSQEAELEQAKRSLMNDYELPECEVTYLRVFAPTGDPVVGSWIHTSMLLANAMQDRYGDRIEVPPQLLSNDPRQDLVRAISARVGDAHGPHHFVIDLYEHGDENQLGFPIPFNAADVAYIARKFPECTFDICSIACFGGGLQNGMQKEFERDPALRERINLFVQTRPDEPNLTSEVTFEPGMMLPTRGSLYHFLMIEALLNDEFETFGAVMRHADLETKKFAPLDAKSIIDGTLIAGIHGETAPIIIV